MKITKFIAMAFVAGALSLGFTSCGDDDDDNNGVTGDNGAAGTGSTEIVSPNVPTGEGWSGNATDGVLTYTVEDDADYADGEANAYYSFKMVGGKCTDAAYNAVFGNDQMAATVARMLNDGSWAYDEDDDDEDYMMAARAAKSIAASVSPKSIRRALARKNVSRASDALIVPVYVKGNVVYIFINAFEGLGADEIKDVIGYWNGDYVNGAVPMPDRFVFGNYNEATGVYTCNNVYALGINYKVETAFTDNVLTNYQTTLTCPNVSWATMMEEELEYEASDMENVFGQKPVVTRSGNAVTVKAVILAELSKEDTKKLLMVYDWMLNEPFFCDLFD